MQTELNTLNNNEQMKVGRRGWVKNFAIIFLAVLLVLTLFSNTIMNYSLPEVACQTPISGTITSRIRGQGTVKSNQSYNLTIDESRQIKSVHVKAGDLIVAGQVVFTLEDEESQELQTAQKELYELELEYQKALVTLSPSYAAKNLEISNAQQELQDALDNQERAGEYQTAYDELRLAVREAEEEVRRVTDEIEAAALSEKTALEAATTAQADYEQAEEKAEAALALREEQLGYTYAEAKAAVIAAEKALEDEELALEALKKQLKDLKSDLSSAYSAGITHDEIESEIQMLLNTHAEATYELTRLMEAGEDTTEVQYWVDSIETEIEYLQYRLSNVAEGNTSSLQDAVKAKEREVEAKEKEIDKAKEEVTKAKNNMNDRALANAQANLDLAKRQVTDAKDQVYNAQKAYDQKIASFDDVKAQADRAVEDAEKALTQFGEDNEVDAPPSPETARDAVIAAQQSLEALYVTLNEEMRADGKDASLAELALEDQRHKIAEKQTDIDKLKSETIDVEITSKYGGTVSSLNAVAGDQVNAGDTLAVVEVTDKGYTLSFTVTNEQARKVRAGDRAEVMYYYGGEVTAVLASIKNAPDSGGRSKELTFELTGEGLMVDEQLTLSVGSRSQSYDVILPNSAIREDANGKFVLLLESKSGPLGNRYYAKRLDIEVVESDDTNSAVAGGLYNYDYVITTASAPLESGQMVRTEES